MATSAVASSIESAAEARRLVADDGFRAALDAQFDNVAIGVAVRDAQGTIVDFELVHINASPVDGAGRTHEEMVGRRLLDLYPSWADHGMLDRFAKVVETGEPFLIERYRYDDTTNDGTPIDGYWSMSVVRFGDGYLAASRDVTELVRDEQERLRARHEAERAHQAVALLQRAALPTSLPEVPGLDLAALYKPASADQPVGGDWYDAFTLGETHLGMVIGDIAGHGPDAAAFMVQVRNVVRALAAEHIEPDRVLARANAVVVGFGEQELFGTCCYGVVDLRQSTFTWALAGHPGPLLVGPVARVLEGPSGPPLGVAPDAAYVSGRVSLNQGEQVLLYTDGLVEDRRRSLDEAMAALVHAAHGWSAGTAEGTAEAAAALAPGLDDVALLCVRLGL